MMKKIIFYSSILSLLILMSCEDNVDPKTTPQEGYVFYCFINADTTLQTAYIGRTYDVSGTNPLENHTDPAISKANVVINYKNKNYIFADSSISRTDTSRYKNNFQFYYNNKLSLKSETIFDVPYPVSVTVTLPNNKVLTSQTESIPAGDLFIGTYHSSFKPEVYLKFNVFTWGFYSTQNSINKYYYLPILEINYSKMENGIPVRKKIQVPSSTFFANGGEINGYPKVSKENLIIYNKQYVIETLKKLSAGDSNKGNYIIHNLMMTLTVMDRNVAAYYSENTTFDSEFSVRIDPPNATNVSGGYGWFGLSAKKKKEVSFGDFDFSITGYGYQFEHKL